LRKNEKIKKKIIKIKIKKKEKDKEKDKEKKEQMEQTKEEKTKTKQQRRRRRRRITRYPRGRNLASDNNPGLRAINSPPPSGVDI